MTDYMICQNQDNHLLYALKHGRFWFWDKHQNKWVPSDWAAQQYAKAQTKEPDLTQEDWLGDCFGILMDDYEVPDAVGKALRALSNKEEPPCKVNTTAPNADAAVTMAAPAATLAEETSTTQADANSCPPDPCSPADASGAMSNPWFAGRYGDISAVPILFTLKAGTYTVKDCVIFSGGEERSNTFTISYDLPITGVRNAIQTVGVSYNDVIYPRLMAGSEDTGWEPYVGGIPSPNPEYPQEIKSVVNPVVKVIGKNLLSKPKLFTRTNLGITVSSAGQGKITVKGTATGDAIFDYWEQNFRVPKGARLLCKILHGSGSNKNKIYLFTNDYRGGLSAKFGEISPEIFDYGYTCEMVRVLIPSGESVDCTLGLSLQMDASTNYEPYHEQTATLPYTLNAIPVTSGGNVTIDGQQYIADYVDVEQGKLVRMVDSSKLDNTQSIVGKNEWLLAEPQGTDLTTEEITAFKALTTYYPTTNISVNSEQLDGYTVFNYPISMQNGWNYVKQQLNDNRDYIYDMDLQSAEAYVNSEYAVALTELEV